MNLPNKITLTRIILIPFVLFFYLASFIPYGKLVALILFVIAVLTDFLDGKLARKLGLTSTIGSFMDSIADKMLTLCSLALVVCDGTIMQPIGVISLSVILCRELIVSALRQLGASQNILIHADMWGKVKATFQFFCIALFMLLSFLKTTFELSNTLLSVCDIVCYIVLAITVFLTILSGIHYLVKNKQVFVEKSSK